MTDGAGETLHASAKERVGHALALGGLADRIRTVSRVRSASATARALGTDVWRIAKTVMLTVDGSPILVVIPGNRRVALEKVRASLGAHECGLSDAGTVQAIAGFDLTGVSPVGSAVALPVFIDEELAQPGVLYAAAGSDDAVFQTTYPELMALTGGTPVNWGRSKTEG